jgi:hypothetical protein
MEDVLPTLIERYESRPAELHHLTLFEFVSWFEFEHQNEPEVAEELGEYPRGCSEKLQINKQFHTAPHLPPLLANGRKLPRIQCGNVIMRMRRKPKCVRLKFLASPLSRAYFVLPLCVPFTKESNFPSTSVEAIVEAVQAHATTIRQNATYLSPALQAAVLQSLQRDTVNFEEISGDPPQPEIASSSDDDSDDDSNNSEDSDGISDDDNSSCDDDNIYYDSETRSDSIDLQQTDCRKRRKQKNRQRTKKARVPQHVADPTAFVNIQQEILHGLNTAQAQVMQRVTRYLEKLSQYNFSLRDVAHGRTTDPPHKPSPFHLFVTGAGMLKTYAKNYGTKIKQNKLC